MKPLLALALLVTGAASAQEVKFSSDVKVVSLLASVRNRDGAIVRNLTRDDFRLEEDGRLQTIRYFSQETDLPLTIALLVDTSRSMQTVFEPERIATNRFLEQMLRPDRDRAAVVHFDYRVRMLQDFTSSREKIADVLARLRIPRIPSTLLYDAVLQASDDLMRKQTGRKAFIVLSDGLDVRSQNTLSKAIEFAQRADTMIYTILFAHPGGRGGRGLNLSIGPSSTRGAKVMARLADETGGAFFQVSGSNPIDGIYAQIEDELRTQYSIGFTPERAGGSGKYRKLKLTTTQKNLVVRARDGYYPK